MRVYKKLSPLSTEAKELKAEDVLLRLFIAGLLWPLGKMPSLRLPILVVFQLDPPLSYPLSR